jgi:hypothetical protein
VTRRSSSPPSRRGRTRDSAGSSGCAVRSDLSTRARYAKGKAAFIAKVLEDDR